MSGHMPEVNNLHKTYPNHIHIQLFVTLQTYVLLSKDALRVCKARYSSNVK